jgi:hypothetical protein
VADSFASVAADLRGLFDKSAVDDLRHVAGLAAKDAAADAARGDLGGDMAMSNFKGGGRKLKSGYEFEGGTSLVLGLRPAGLWNLADRGRRTSGVIRPKKGKLAVATGLSSKNNPRGLRAGSRFGPSRGLGTVDDAEKRIEEDAYKAVDRAVAERVGGF